MSLRPLLELVEPNHSKDDLDTVEAILEQFSALDPDSFAFRYPVSRNMDPSLPTIRHINLDGLNTVMIRIASFIDAVDCMLDAYLDAMAEAAGYYESEY